MKLNYQLRISNITNNAIPIVMIHGLFANLNSLRSLSSHLSKYYQLIQVDVRNHGNSPHSNSMTYFEMAHDILELLNYLSIKKYIVLGHSMGGKIAMTLCSISAHRIVKAIIIDIAPVKYSVYKHKDIFNAINCINELKIKTKKKAFQIMKNIINDSKLVLFLLKSFRSDGSWTFNFYAIEKNYNFISDWNSYHPWWGPILFLRGELSSYIDYQYINDIYHQFPFAYINTVPNTTHWMHFENLSDTLYLINKFLLREN